MRFVLFLNFLSRWLPNLLIGFNVYSIGYSKRLVRFSVRTSVSTCGRTKGHATIYNTHVIYATTKHSLNHVWSRVVEHVEES